MERDKTVGTPQFHAVGFFAMNDNPQDLDGDAQLRVDAKRIAILLDRVGIRADIAVGRVFNCVVKGLSGRRGRSTGDKHANGSQPANKTDGVTHTILRSAARQF